MANYPHDAFAVALRRAENTAAVAVEDMANCWSLGESIGHRGPHVLRHFLSRARWNGDVIRGRLATWAVEQFGEVNTVLVLDEDR